VLSTPKWKNGYVEYMGLKSNPIMSIYDIVSPNDGKLQLKYLTATYIFPSTILHMYFHTLFRYNSDITGRCSHLGVSLPANFFLQRELKVVNIHVIHPTCICLLILFYYSITALQCPALKVCSNMCCSLRIT